MKTEAFKVFSDRRGDLIPIEFDKIPFVPKRCFVIDNVNAGEVRGRHRHKECLQYLICTSGVVYVDYIIAREDKSIYGRQYLSKGVGIFIDKMTWVDLVFKEYDSRLLVLCSHPYDPDDYITQKP